MNNETILEYINSKDIREHLRSINYEFTPVECAFLIYQSNKTIKQKHSAWKDLIATMPDCPVNNSHCTAGWNSLHTMLSDYMTFEDKCLSKFMLKEPNAIYSDRYQCRYNENSIAEWMDSNVLFSDYQDCYTYAISDNDNKNHFKIIKRYIDINDYAYFEVIFDYTGAIVDWYMVNETNILPLTEAESRLYTESFDGMWFDFPIPFKKGEIVCDYINQEPFVLLGTVPWFKKEQEAQRKQPRKDWKYYLDISDMQAYGYSYEASKMFFNDDFRIDYLNLEYYRKELKDGEKLLLALSKYILDGKNVDEYTLLKLFRMINAESIYKQDKQHLKSYLPENIRKEFFCDEE